MTVGSQTTKITALGNDSATSFSFSPLVLYASTDLTVTHVDADGEETPLSEGTGASNYSVSVSMYPGTGSITYPADEVTPLPTGEKLIMKAVYTLEQQTDLESQGGYDPEVLERQLDKLLRIDLQQQELIDRSLILPISVDASVVLPIPEAGKPIGWNEDGDAIVNLTPNSETYIELPLTVANGGTGATTAAAARTALGAGAAGASVFQAATAAAVRALLGSDTTGDALFQTATVAAARAILDVSGHGWQLADDSVDASAADAVEFFDLASGYDHGFEFIGCLPDSNSPFKALTSPDTGESPTYGAAGEHTATYGAEVGVGTLDLHVSTDHIALYSGNTSNQNNTDATLLTNYPGLSGFVWLRNPQVAGPVEMVIERISYQNASNAMCSIRGNAWVIAATVVTAIRFWFGTFETNTITGTIKHWVREIQS